MSTQINVTVDSGGLRQRDKQQRQALRFGKSEADNQAKVRARATDQRTIELRKELLGADGKPLYGSGAWRAARKEEPAATPVSAPPSFLLLPASDFGPYGIEAQVKGFKNKRWYPEIYEGVAYGPLVTESSFTLGYGMLGDSWPPGTGSGFAWTHVIDNADALGFTYTDGNYYFLVDTLDGQVNPRQIKRKVQDLKEFTIEFMYRGAGVEPVDYGFLYQDGAFRLLSTTVGFTLKWPSLTGTFDNYFDLFEINLACEAHDDFVSPEIRTRMDTLIVVYFENLPYSPETPYRYLDIRYGSTQDWYNSGVATHLISERFDETAWHHIAYSYTEGESFFFIDGVRYSTPETETNPIRPLIPLNATCQVALNMYNYADNSETVDLAGAQARIKQLRFTPRALYTANFTPPTSIATLL